MHPGDLNWNVNSKLPSSLLMNWRISALCESRRTHSMTRPRLLFVIDEDAYFCSHRLDLARAARDAGFDVLVATLVQHHAKQIEEEGFKLLPIQLRRGVQPPLHDLASLVELIRLYRREQPDIVHHVSMKQVLVGAIAA